MEVTRTCFISAIFAYFCHFSCAAAPWRYYLNGRNHHGNQSSFEKKSAYIHLSFKMPNLTEEQNIALMFGRDKMKLKTGKIFRDGYYKPTGPDIVDWKVDNLTQDVFEYNSDMGRVTVRATGLYALHSEVIYAGLYGGHQIMVQGPKGDRILCQCKATSLRHYRHRLSSPVGTCHTGVVTPLAAGDSVWIRLKFKHSALTLRDINSHWGIVKLQEN